MSGDVCPGGNQDVPGQRVGAPSESLQVVPLQRPHPPGSALAQLGSRFRPGPASPHPRLFSEELAFLVLPSGCCHPRLRRCPVSRPPGKGGFSGASSLCSCDVPSPHKEAGVWQQGWGPRPESRPSHSHVQGLARTREPPVPPPERPSHRPALSPSCTWASCPCRGVQAAEGRVRGRSPHLRGPGAPFLGSAQMEVAPGGR